MMFCSLFEACVAAHCVTVTHSLRASFRRITDDTRADMDHTILADPARNIPALILSIVVSLLPSPCWACVSSKVSHLIY